MPDGSRWCICPESVNSTPPKSLYSRPEVSAVIHPLIYGTLAILGHLFPIFLKFKGGKGISCFAGVITCYFWPLAVVGLITFVLVAIITKYISVASTLGTLSLIIAYFIMQKNDMYLFIFLILTFILIIIKHIPNYKRLIHNEENKIKLFDKKS